MDYGLAWTVGSAACGSLLGAGIAVGVMRERDRVRGEAIERLTTAIAERPCASHADRLKGVEVKLDMTDLTVRESLARIEGGMQTLAARIDDAMRALATRIDAGRDR